VESVTGAIRSATGKKEAGKQFEIVAGDSAATVSPGNVITHRAAGKQL